MVVALKAAALALTLQTAWSGGSGGGAFVGWACDGDSNTPLEWGAQYDGGWYDILMNINPYLWAYLGLALSLGFSVIGAAWGAWRGSERALRRVRFCA